MHLAADKHRRAVVQVFQENSKPCYSDAMSKAIVEEQVTLDNDPKSAEGLSFRQRHILSFIKNSISKRGYPPTMREIGAEVGLTSPSSVKHQLAALERKGYLRRDPNLPRAIEVVDPLGVQAPLRPSGVSPKGGGRLSIVPDEADAIPRDQPVYVPLVGRIAAGVPITAEQDVEQYFALPHQLVKDGEFFMLSVKGDSMIDAAICDGDWVVVRRQNVAEKGEVVAALLDGEATVKVFSKDKDHVWLLPRNQTLEPILGDDAQIMGRVVAVMRRL